MTADLTVANLMAMWVVAYMLVPLALLRAYDQWQARRSHESIAKVGFALSIFAFGTECLFWWVRWVYKASGNPDTNWFVDNAEITLIFGVMATIGGILAFSGAAWPSLRYAAPIISVCGAAAIWIGGIIV